MENGNPSNAQLQSVLQDEPGDGPGSGERCAPPLPHWDLGCQVWCGKKKRKKCVCWGRGGARVGGRWGINHQSLGNVRELRLSLQPMHHSQAHCDSDSLQNLPQWPSKTQEPYRTKPQCWANPPGRQCGWSIHSQERLHFQKKGERKKKST